MTRHVVGYTARGPSWFKNVRMDEYRNPTLLMEEGETRKLALDLTDLLEAGESISAAVVTATGVTAAISLESPIITLTLSAAATWGEVTVTITLSSGEVIVETIRVRKNMRNTDPTEIAYVA